MSAYILAGFMPCITKSLRCTTGLRLAVLADESGGVLPCHFDPAGVDFGLEILRRDSAVEHIQRVLAVQLDELEIMVVIEQRDTGGSAGRGRWY